MTQTRLFGSPPPPKPDTIQLLPQIPPPYLCRGLGIGSQGTGTEGQGRFGWVAASSDMLGEVLMPRGSKDNSEERVCRVKGNSEGKGKGKVMPSKVQ